MVKLVSAEEQAFQVPHSLVQQSPTLRLFLDPQLGFLESHTGEIHLPAISTRLLSRIIEYLQWRQQAALQAEDPLDFPIDPAEATELLMVADYLDI